MIQQAKTHKEAYYQGFNAFLSGEQHNPYEIASKAYQKWEEGYQYSKLWQDAKCTKVTFKNHEQEILEWYINYANIVIDSRPHREKWIGSQVYNTNLSIGILLKVKTPMSEEVTLDFPILAIEPLTDDEYQGVSISYKKWLHQMDLNVLNHKAKFTGQLIAQIITKDEQLSIFALDNKADGYLCFVKNLKSYLKSTLLVCEHCYSKKEIFNFFGFKDFAIQLYKLSGLFSEEEIETFMIEYRDGY